MPFGRPRAPFWRPFGSLRAPFGVLWAPFGSLWPLRVSILMATAAILASLCCRKWLVYWFVWDVALKGFLFQWISNNVLQLPIKNMFWCNIACKGSAYYLPYAPLPLESTQRTLFVHEFQKLFIQSIKKKVLMACILPYAPLPLQCTPFSTVRVSASPLGAPQILQIPFNGTSHATRLPFLVP